MGAPSKLREAVGGTEKLCTKCAAWKPADTTHFSPFKDGVLRLHPWCRDCLRDYARRRVESKGAKVRKTSWVPPGAPPRITRVNSKDVWKLLPVHTEQLGPECRFKAYLLANRITGEKYVGITERSLAARWRQHVSAVLAGDKGQFVHAAIRHYGMESFDFTWVACAKTRADLNALEQLLIEQHDTVAHGYNQTRGGSDGESVGNPVEVDGQRFISIGAAARHYGVEEWSVHQRVNRYGWTLRQALELDSAPLRKPARGRATEVQGMTFDSIKDAAQHFGLMPNVVQSRLDLGWPIEQALGLQPRPKRKPTRTRAITIGGVQYNSIVVAANAHGVPRALLSDRLQKGWTPEEAVGLVPRRERSAPNARRITIDGVQYKSVRAACDARGFNYGKVHSRIKLGWTLQQAFDLAPPPPPSGQKNGRPVTVNGVTYFSRSAAAHAHGVDPRVVHKRLKLGWSLERAITCCPGQVSTTAPK